MILRSPNYLCHSISVFVACASTPPPLPLARTAGTLESVDPLRSIVDPFLTEEGESELSVQGYWEQHGWPKWEDERALEVGQCKVRLGTGGQVTRK
jgi:hypothetical protein